MNENGNSDKKGKGVNLDSIDILCYTSVVRTEQILRSFDTSARFRRRIASQAPSLVPELGQGTEELEVGVIEKKESDML